MQYGVPHRTIEPFRISDFSRRGRARRQGQRLKEHPGREAGLQQDLPPTS